MKRESVGRTFAVATILCVVCSIFVSVAAVSLRPLQNKNKEEFKRKNILIAAGIYDKDKPVDEQFDRIKVQLIDLSTGQEVSDSEVDPETYDQREAASSPALSVDIPSDKNVAGIKRREKYSFVYFLMNGDKVEQIILPVYGKGLWSTMYGFLALSADTTTVKGITFYSHGETPGLGGEIDNPKWQAEWVGKKIYDEDGEIDIRVIKGKVDPNSPAAEHEVDGLSGATITSNGVTNLVHYWLSDDAFGPFLEKFRAEQHGGSDG